MAVKTELTKEHSKVEMTVEKTVGKLDIPMAWMMVENLALRMEIELAGS